MNEVGYWIGIDEDLLNMLSPEEVKDPSITHHVMTTLQKDQKEMSICDVMLFII